MARILSVQVDNKLNDAIEADMAAMSIEMGQEVTPSQYLRLVLNARLQLAEPLPVGVGEGMRRGFAKLMARMQDVMAEIAEEESAAAG